MRYSKLIWLLNSKLIWLLRRPGGGAKRPAERGDMVPVLKNCKYRPLSELRSMELGRNLGAPAATAAASLPTHLLLDPYLYRPKTSGFLRTNHKPVFQNLRFFKNQSEVSQTF